MRSYDVGRPTSSLLQNPYFILNMQTGIGNVSYSTTATEVLLSILIMTDIEKYESLMRRCIELAKIAKKRGDSPVGSLIVKDGKIIAEGIEGGKTHKDVTFHAEIEAVRKATASLGKTDLSDCFMVTTHEPCIMCSYVIRHYKIGLIIVGMPTGEIGGYSSALPVLLDRTISKWNTPPRIIDKILEDECRELHT